MWSGGFTALAVLLLVLLPWAYASFQDGAALMSIFDSLNISPPSWANGIDPCLVPTPDYVFCSSGDVITLNLSSLGLKGPIPNAIGDLGHLQVLDLQNNQLTGSVPPGFSNLEDLQSLYLTKNSLTGPFPNTVLQLTGLLDLRIDGNFFEGPLPADIVNLTELNYLYLGGNQFTGLVPIGWRKLASIGKLKYLRLDHNKLQGFFPLWTSPIKDTLDLRCNYFTGRSPAGFNYSTAWQGNCFYDYNNADDHTDSSCADATHSGSCTSFLSANPLASPPPPPQASPVQPAELAETSSRTPRTLIAGVVACVSTIIVGGLLCLWRWKVWRKANSNLIGHEDPYSLRRTDLVDQEDSWRVPPNLRRFSLRSLEAVTGGFRAGNEIGSGGFGKVYYAKLGTGEEVAIKKANPEKRYGSSEFRNELFLLSKLSHPNLVAIVGFCDDDEQQILVYEFMSNGNLNDCLTGKRLGPALDWHVRIEIALSVAKALEYLHHSADPRVIHRDIKPSNILLDGNMVAKVADFGISKVTPEFGTHVSTRPAGTEGYLDPDYFVRLQLTTASDVFSFGVVLLELVSGQKAMDRSRASEDSNLSMWAYSRLVEGGINSIIDPMLKVKDYPEAAFEEIAWLALDCSAPAREKRPDIKEVVKTLQRIVSSLGPGAAQAAPPQTSRAFYSHRYTPSTDSSSSTGLSTNASAERAAARYVPTESLLPR